MQHRSSELRPPGTALRRHPPLNEIGDRTGQNRKWLDRQVVPGHEIAGVVIERHQGKESGRSSINKVDVNLRIPRDRYVRKDQPVRWLTHQLCPINKIQARIENEEEALDFRYR